MIIAFIIIGLMISTIVVEVFTYVMNKDLKKINKRTSKEQLRLSLAIDKIIADIRYKCIGSAFNNDDVYLVSEYFGSDAVQFLLTTHRKKATTFSDWWYYRKIYKKTGDYFSENNYTFSLKPLKKDYKNFDELKENLMNDLSLQIKQYNITCKIKDLEKDFE
jgi:hypothetical protein